MKNRLPSLHERLGILKIYKVLSKKVRFYIWLLLFCLIITSITELIGIASIIPLINSITNDNEPSFGILNKILNAIEIYSGIDQIKVFGIGVIFLISISYLSRILSNYFTLYTASEIGLYLHNKSIRNYLSSSYKNQVGALGDHLTYCLSQQINQVVSGYIFPWLNAISSLLIFIALSGGLFIIAPKITIIFILITFIFYVLIGLPFLKYLANGSKKLNKSSDEHLSILSGLKWYLKQLNLYNLESEFFKKLSNLQKEIRTYTVRKNFIGTYPKTILEFFIITSAIIIIIFSDINSSKQNISQIIFLLIIIQKLFPVFQTLYVSWTNIIANKHSRDDVLKYCKANNKKKKQGILVSSNDLKYINIEKLSFSYDPKIENVFTNISLNFKIKDYHHIIAPSGYGKSTLIDLILGLQLPTSGKITFQGSELSYKANEIITGEFISYVPQFNFYLDGTIQSILKSHYIGENIKKENILKACKTAKIDKLIRKLPIGINTFCRNNLSEFSGGQKQKFAIAQALLNPNLRMIILDETLSNIDKFTAKSILDNIRYNYPKIGIILVTHDSSIVTENFQEINLIDSSKDIKE
tara:strand:- start:5438 stop:7189 length:1752 start_codon:yes stop_codon:yes gene_type:complete